MKIENACFYEITEKSCTYDMNMYSLRNNLDMLVFKDTKTSLIHGYQLPILIAKYLTKGYVDSFEMLEDKMIFVILECDKYEATTRVIEYREISSQEWLERSAKNGD